MFATAGVNLKFHSWPIEPSEEVVYKQQGSGNITAISWSKDNGYLTFVTEKGNPEIISLKDPNNIRQVHSISAISGASTIAFQRTTKKGIGIGTRSGQVALYDTRNKLISKLFQNNPCSVNLLDFNIEDTHMAVACTNGTVLLYDVNQGDICQTFIASNTYSPTSMGFHPSDEHTLNVAMADGTVMEWDFNIGVTKFCAQIHTAPVTGLAVAKQSGLMVSVGYDHKFCIHDLNRECTFRGNHQYPLTAVDVSYDGLIIAIGSESGILYVYDIRKLMHPLATVRAHSTRINKVMFEHEVKYGSIDEPPISGQAAREVEVKSETPSLIGTEVKSNTKVLCVAKVADGTDFKRAPNKQTEDQKESAMISLKSIKHEVQQSIKKSTNELRNHLMAQFGSLHNFISNEFRTIDAQMDEKWDILNLAKDVTLQEPDSTFEKLSST